MTHAHAFRISVNPASILARLRRLAEPAHHGLLLAAVGLHLSALGFYRLIKRRNLVAAMLSGWQTYAGQPPELRFASWKLAVLCALVAAGVVAGVVNGLGG